MRILLVEDNTRLAQTVAKGLREQSFAVAAYYNYGRFVAKARIFDV